MKAQCLQDLKCLNKVSKIEAVPYLNNRDVRTPRNTIRRLQIMKQKKKLFALLLAICVMVAGTSAFAADTAIVMRSTAPNGSARPLHHVCCIDYDELPINWRRGGNLYLNMSMTRSVSKAYC